MEPQYDDQYDPEEEEMDSDCDDCVFWEQANPESEWGICSKGVSQIQDPSGRAMVNAEFSCNLFQPREDETEGDVKHTVMIQLMDKSQWQPHRRANAAKCAEDSIVPDERAKRRKRRSKTAKLAGRDR